MLWLTLRIEDRNLARVKPARAARRLDRLLRNVLQNALSEHFAIVGDEEVSLLCGEQVVVASADQLRARNAEQELACAVEAFEPQILGIFDEYHGGQVLDDRVQELAHGA